MFWTYMLLARSGRETYTGYTGNLKRRFRQHNHVNNRGYTKGRKWFLLAARAFESQDEAMAFESLLKGTWRLKMEWVESTGRLAKLERRHGIKYVPHEQPVYGPSLF